MGIIEFLGAAVSGKLDLINASSIELILVFSFQQRWFTHLRTLASSVLFAKCLSLETVISNLLKSGNTPSYAFCLSNFVNLFAYVCTMVSG